MRGDVIAGFYRCHDETKDERCEGDHHAYNERHEVKGISTTVFLRQDLGDRHSKATARAEQDKHDAGRQKIIHGLSALDGLAEHWLNALRLPSERLSKTPAWAGVNSMGVHAGLVPRPGGDGTAL